MRKIGSREFKNRMGRCLSVVRKGSARLDTFGETPMKGFKAVTSRGKSVSQTLIEDRR
jgi:hypothetical protein